MILFNKMKNNKKIVSFIKCILFAFLITITAFSISAQHSFDYNQKVENIYQQILQLEFDTARQQITEEKIKNPTNLALTHLENYIDFFSIFIYEDQPLFESLQSNKNKRLAHLENWSDPSDPYYLFAKAEIKLQWALARIKFEEYITASKELYGAYTDLEKNLILHPQFQLSKKSLSIIHALVETIPIPLFLKDLFGIKGNITQGIEEIEAVIDHTKTNHQLFQTEAIVIYAFIELYQNANKDKAWEIINSSALNEPQNPLEYFVTAKIAQRVGRNDIALQLLTKFKNEYPDSPFAFMDFMLGMSTLRKLDPEANTHFLRFISNHKGTHYIKEAYQKMAWYELVFYGDIAGYKKHMLSCKTQGEAITDGDKQALNQSETLEIPDITLLKARLLFDGGYYQKAYNVLIKEGHHYYANETYNLTFRYRLGRVSQALLNYPEAIREYTAIFENEAYKKSYYTCNGALQLGLIYEEQKQYTDARLWFNRCLSLSPAEYKSSLHQKAKSGILRIKDL